MRQWLFILLAVCSAGASSLLLPGINRQREECGLTANPVMENVPPELALATTVLGGFRGVVVDVLWMRATSLQQASKFFELVQLFDWIGKLEPRCAQVWVYSAWNMAWNISVEMPNAPDRWRWIQKGIEVLRSQGIPWNQRSAELYRELAWIYSNKIGSSVDEFHRYYKAQVAIEVEDVMGRGPATNIKPFVQAAKTLEELQKRVDAKPLLEALRLAGYKPLARPRQVLTALDERDAKALAVIDAPQYAKARDAFVMFLRRRSLTRDLKLDPEYMQKLADEFGPMDWRLPAPRALYYASKALDVATTEDFALNYERIKYSSIKRLYIRGTLFFDRGAGPDDYIYQTTYNWRFFDATDKVYRTVIAQSNGRLKSSVTAPYRNFLEEAIVLFFASNQTHKARECYARLRREYPNDRYRVPFDKFVMKSVFSTITQVGYDSAKAGIDSILLEAYRWLAAGNEDRATGQFNLAYLMWKYYMKDKDIKVMQQRLGLPTFGKMKEHARDRALRTFPGLLRQRLADRLGVELPQPKPKQTAPPKTPAKKD